VHAYWILITNQVCTDVLQVFLLIQSEKLRNDYVYQSWLARCCE